MSTFSRFSWFATLLMLNACSSGSPQVAGGAGGEPDTQTSVPALVGCEAYSADESTVKLDPADIARIRSLPHFAAAVITLPNAEEFYGSLILSVRPEGERALTLGAGSETMARTVFATIDIDAALQQGAERELYATVQAEAGQISFNGFGQQPVFVAGPLQMTDFRAEPTGFFELLLHVGSLVGWPQSDYPQEEQAVIAEFSNSEVRVLDRLLGTCMVRSGEGDPIRVIDVDSDERCAPLMSHL